MIQLYSGTPGSGKSLHTADKIRCLNMRGIPVITNIQINTKYLKKPDLYFYVDLYDITPAFLVGWYVSHKEKFNIKHEGDIFVFIDECQRIFNSRDYNVSGRRAWLDFFSIHRHFYYNIILIAQWDNMIDKQIRALIEIEVKHRRMWFMGKFGKICEILAMRKLFLVIECYYTLHVKLSMYLTIGRKKIYRLYDTHAVFKQDLPKNLKKQLEENNINI